MGGTSGPTCPRARRPRSRARPRRPTPWGRLAWRWPPRGTSGSSMGLLNTASDHWASASASGLGKGPASPTTPTRRPPCPGGPRDRTGDRTGGRSRASPDLPPSPILAPADPTDGPGTRAKAQRSPATASAPSTPPGPPAAGRGPIRPRPRPSPLGPTSGPPASPRASGAPCPPTGPRPPGACTQHSTPRPTATSAPADGQGSGLWTVRGQGRAGVKDGQRRSGVKTVRGQVLTCAPGKAKNKT
jgi:hypothetical protein